MAQACQGQSGGVWQESNWRFQLENWRYATQPVCQSWESKGQLSVMAMIGGIMGCGDRANGFSVTKKESLALVGLLGEEVADPCLIPQSLRLLSLPTIWCCVYLAAGN